MILGLLEPDSGKIELFGRDISMGRWRFKENIGVLPGDLAWWPYLTGAEILRFISRFRPAKERKLEKELLELFEMNSSLLNRKVRTYSRGERKKLGLVAAMRHDPDLLILDEPTSGLDPMIRHSFFDRCRVLRDMGKTVFLSSHNLYETQKVCDRVGIVNRGLLVALETIASLRRISVCNVEIVLNDPADFSRLNLENAEEVKRSESRISIMYRGTSDDLVRALSRVSLKEIVIAPPSIEDVFMQYLGDASSGDSGRSGR